MVDTNICFYAFDPTDPIKQKTAADLLRQLQAVGNLTISTQVLAELYASLTSAKRKASALSHSDAEIAIKQLAVASNSVYAVNETVVLNAITTVGRYRFSLWDALIFETAKANGETVIYTEDVPGFAGNAIDGISFIDPFASTP